jgi:hypothetical protein
MTDGFPDTIDIVSVAEAVEYLWSRVGIGDLAAVFGDFLDRAADVIGAAEIRRIKRAVMKAGR